MRLHLSPAVLRLLERTWPRAVARAARQAALLAEPGALPAEAPAGAGEAGAPHPADMLWLSVAAEALAQHAPALMIDPPELEAAPAPPPASFDRTRFVSTELTGPPARRSGQADLESSGRPGQTIPTGLEQRARAGFADMAGPAGRNRAGRADTASLEPQARASLAEPAVGPEQWTRAGLASPAAPEGRTSRGPSDLAGQEAWARPGLVVPAGPGQPQQVLADPPAPRLVNHGIVDRPAAGHAADLKAAERLGQVPPIAWPSAPAGPGAPPPPGAAAPAGTSARLRLAQLGAQRAERRRQLEAVLPEATMPTAAAPQTEPPNRNHIAPEPQPIQIHKQVDRPPAQAQRLPDEADLRRMLAKIIRTDALRHGLDLKER